MTTEKFCTKCGKKFIATGREVICPACKQAAAEDAKRAAVLKAKKASWAGESVPVRISGRASMVIRRYGAANNLSFAAALDALLQASTFFKNTGKAWEDVTPYKSRRRNKATSTTETEEAQEVTSKPQETPQDKQDGAQATSKQASKPQKVTKAAKKAIKTSKAAEKGGKE